MSRSPRRPARVVRLLAALAVTVGLAACSSSPQEMSNVDDARDTGEVTLALPQSRVTATLRAQLEAWNQAHPDERATTVSLPDDPAAARDQLLSDADSGTATASVVGLDSDRVAEFVEESSIEALPAARFPLRDYAAPMAGLGRDGDRVVAVPYRVRTEVLYYRADLLGGNPPSTWDELRQACANVAKPKGMGCLRAPLTGKAGLLDTLTRLVAANGGQLIDDDGVPHADDPATVAAVTKLTEAVAAGDIAAIDADREANRQAFREGKTLFLWDDTTVAGSVVGSSASVAALPRLGDDGRAVVTADMLAIPTTARHKKSALELMAFLAAPERAAERVRGDGDASPSADQYDDATKNAHPELAVARQVLPAAQAGPAVARRSEVDATVADYLEPVIRGTTPVQTGLELLQSRLERLTPS